MSKSIDNFHRTLVPHMTNEKDESVFSSFSIFSALAMTSSGADGNTLDEFNKMMFMDQENIHREMRKMHRSLNGLGNQLSIAEAIFTMSNILEGFKNNVVSNYYAQIVTTKFPQPGEKQVNDFVQEKTKGLIPKIVDNLDPLTRMILINAVYFKANWKRVFKKKDTIKKEIFDSHGTEMRVDYLFRRQTKEYYSRDKINGVGFVSCSLPYDGNDFSMVFVKSLKKGDRAMSLLMKNVVCSPNFVRRIMSKQTELKLKRLMIPKFTIESSYKMKDTLTRMGLVDAFSEANADFSKMTGEKDLMIDDVIHKAKIIVDEVGTEAAAATVVVMRKRGCVRPSPEPKQAEFVLNRPFFCFVVHNKSKMVLFSTTVVEPRFKK